MKDTSDKMKEDKRLEFELGYAIKKGYADNDDFMELIYQSNLIEGIGDYWIGTAVEGEEFKVEPTITGHEDALAYISENHTRKISHEGIKQTHLILMKSLMKNPGEYRNRGHSFMASGGEFIAGNPLHGHILPLMDSWIDKADRADSFDKMLDLHYEYEAIHPFSDGNGRSGRLLLNWMTLQKLDLYTIIKKSNRDLYFRKIRDYRSEFMKNHTNIIFTTYKMLDNEEKKRLKKEKEEYYKFRRELFSYNHE